MTPGFSGLYLAPARAPIPLLRTGPPASAGPVASLTTHVHAMSARIVVPLALLALALSAACASRSAPPDGLTPGLLPSVQASTYGDSVRFMLQVTNTAEQPVELEFRSGQEFDFVVENDGREIWRWSADQMFTQAIRHRTLPPGETLTFAASWTPAPQLRGEFVVRGVLTAAEHRVEQQARFRIP